MAEEKGWFDQVQDFAESAAGTGANAASDYLEKSKQIPFVGNVISGVQGSYHNGAAIYAAQTGDRDAAVSHGVQSLMGLAGMHPTVSGALGTADQVLGITGSAARGAASVPGSPVKPGDIPASITDVLAMKAVEATNTIFGKDDTNTFAPGDKPMGTRQGEINAGTGMIANSVLGMMSGGAIGNAIGGDKAIGDLVGNFFGEHFGDENRNQPGTTSGVAPNAAAQAGQEKHKLIKDLAAGGGSEGDPGMPPVDLIGPGGLVDAESPPAAQEPPTMPIPLRPDGGTPGHGGASTPGGSGSSFHMDGPGSHGSPGQQLGPADGTIGPTSPGSGQPAAGPMPYGTSPKGSGAPMSGPAPKLPWFFENAGPSTW